MTPDAYEAGKAVQVFVYAVREQDGARLAYLVRSIMAEALDLRRSSGRIVIGSLKA